MNKFILLTIILLGVFTVWFYVRYPLTTKVTIRGHQFLVEVAATNAEKEKGLGYRDSLPENSGMIFPYDHQEQYKYWMKGMRFPIDIIWIRDHTIMDISKNVPMATNGALLQYVPAVAVNKVLEINAGLSDKLGIQIGDTVTIRN